MSCYAVIERPDRAGSPVGIDAQPRLRDHAAFMNDLAEAGFVGLPDRWREVRADACARCRSCAQTAKTKSSTALRTTPGQTGSRSRASNHGNSSSAPPRPQPEPTDAARPARGSRRRRNRRRSPARRGRVSRPARARPARKRLHPGGVTVNADAGATKRPTALAVGRNPRETGAKSGKTAGPGATPETVKCLANSRIRRRAQHD
jgi:hypothetical protein